MRLAIQFSVAGGFHDSLTQTVSKRLAEIGHDVLFQKRPDGSWVGYIDGAKARSGLTDQIQEILEFYEGITRHCIFILDDQWEDAPLLLGPRTRPSALAEVMT